MSHNRYPESKVRLTPRGKLAASVAGGLIAASSLVLLTEHAKNSPNVSQDERNRAIEAVTDTDGEYVLLESGATLRYTPVRIEEKRSGETNRAYTVPEGQQLLVKMPVNSANSGWEGVHDPRAEGNLASDTLWFNLPELADQGKAQVVDHYGKSGTYSVTIVDGRFTNQTDPAAAVAEVEVGPVGSFDDQLPQQ